MKIDHSIPFIFQFLEERTRDTQKEVIHIDENALMGVSICGSFYPWNYPMTLDIRECINND